MMLAIELLLGLGGKLPHVVLDHLGQKGAPSGMRLALLLYAHAGGKWIRGFSVDSIGSVGGIARDGVNGRRIEAAGFEDGFALRVLEVDAELVGHADGTEARVVATHILSHALTGGDGGLTPLGCHVDELEHLPAELDFLAELVAVCSGAFENGALLGCEDQVDVDCVPEIIFDT